VQYRPPLGHLSALLAAFELAAMAMWRLERTKDGPTGEFISPCALFFDKQSNILQAGLANLQLARKIELRPTVACRHLGYSDLF